MSGESTPERGEDGATAAVDTDRWTWPTDGRWRGSRRLVGGAALVATLAPLWLLGGVVGVAAWLVVAGSWLLFAPVVPVAIGQFALVAATTAATPQGGVAAATLLAVLGGDFVDRPTTGGGITREGVVYALCYTGLCLTFAGVVFGVAATDGVVAAAVAAGVVVAAVAYTLYRYSVVAFGPTA